MSRRCGSVKIGGRPPEYLFASDSKAHARDFGVAFTAVGGDFVEPSDAPPGCWCCGYRAVRVSLLRLGEHPEVAVCFRCVKVLAKRKREMERRTKSAPVGWPFWRRVRYRAGFGRC